MTHCDFCCEDEVCEYCSSTELTDEDKHLMNEICREFALWLSSKSRDKSDPMMEHNANRWVEDFIAEMEEKEENGRVC